MVNNLDNLPKELKALPQWVLWKLETDTNNKTGKVRKTKLPYQINGEKAEANNPETWKPYYEVRQTLSRQSSKYNGIGFVFTEEAGYIGIDFDHVIKDGVCDPVVLGDVELLNSYTEKSQSGEGLHIIIKAKLSDDLCTGEKKTGVREGNGGIREVYKKGRFFALTGDIYTDRKEISEKQEEFNTFFNKYFDRSTKQPVKREISTTAKNTQPATKKASPKMADEDIVNICKSAKNAEKFNRLFNGDTSDYGNDSSAADQALCNLLAFYTQNPAQIDSIFRQSGLMREKWERSDYSSKTITNAINIQTDVFTKENDAEDYAEKLRDIPIKQLSRLADAKAFIKENMMSERKDIVDAFIQEHMKVYFGLKNDEVANIKQYYKSEKKAFEEAKIKESAKKDLEINEKYTSMYSMYINSQTDSRVKINPHPDKIAEAILKEEHIITIKDSMYIFRDGFYRPENETIKDKIVFVLNEICKGDNSDHIESKITDVITQIMAKTRAFDYPFNKDMNKLPVLNGILEFDFEAEKVKLVKTDPSIHKFNYMIPVEYSETTTNDEIFKVYGQYVDNPIVLIQMYAQAFMQAMGHGPYKRAYLLYGKKNSGKTTFMESAEEFIGREGVADVTLDSLTRQFSVASLEGKLINLHDDQGYMTLKDTGRFKTLSGKMVHEVERKGVQPYNVTLTAVHCISTNTPAKFDTTVKTDSAFWERWDFVTFDKSFRMNGSFKNVFKNPENKTGLLKTIIKTMLEIGKTKELLTKTDWVDTRDNWMLAGNPLYAMIKDIATLNVYEKGTCKKRGTAILKEELLQVLQKWCVEQEWVDPRVIPDSIKDVTQLVEACGWESDEKRCFNNGKTENRCYVIPYTMLQTKEAYAYWKDFTREAGTPEVSFNEDITVCERERCESTSF